MGVPHDPDENRLRDPVARRGKGRLWLNAKQGEFARQVPVSRSARRALLRRFDRLDKPI